METIRHDIIYDINYSYALEKMQATLCGRVDRFLSFLILFFGAAVFADFRGTIFYGGLIACVAAFNSVYQFGKNSAVAQSRAYQYLALIRDVDSLENEQLVSKLKLMEKDDSHIFSILRNAAQQRATICLGLRDNPPIKLTKFEKIISWLAGDLPNQSEYLKNNTGLYPESESDN